MTVHSTLWKLHYNKAQCLGEDIEAMSEGNKILGLVRISFEHRDGNTLKKLLSAPTSIRIWYTAYALLAEESSTAGQWDPKEGT